MLYSQKYCLVSFNSSLEIDIEFEMTDWPLHITLADVFSIDLDKDLEKKLTELLANRHQVVTSAVKEVVLGETEVVLLENNDRIKDLHKHLINLLESEGAVFNNPEFIKEGFLPHCTIQKTERLNPGDTVKIDSITLIDMFPNNNWQQRKVLHNFKMR